MEGSRHPFLLSPSDVRAYLRGEWSLLLAEALARGALAESAVIARAAGLPVTVVRALHEHGMAPSPPSGGEAAPFREHALDSIALPLWSECLAQAMAAVGSDDSAGEEQRRQVTERMLELVDRHPGEVELDLVKVFLEEFGGDEPPAPLLEEVAEHIRRLKADVEGETQLGFGALKTILEWSSLDGGDGSARLAGVFERAVTNEWERLGGSEHGDEGEEAFADLSSLLEGMERFEPQVPGETYRRALDAIAQLLRESQDPAGELEVLERLAPLCIKADSLPEVIASQERILSLNRELRRPDGEARALVRLRNAHFDSGDAERARQLHAQAVSAYEEAGDSMSLKVLGQECTEHGEVALARESLEKALAVARDKGERSQEGDVLIDLGNAHIELGEHEKALECYREALAVHEETGNRVVQAIAKNNIGLLRGRGGEAREAIGLFEEALAIYEDESYRPGEADSLRNLGAAHAELGDHEAAMRFLERALRAYDGLSSARGRADVLELLARSHAATGDVERAAELEELARKADPGRRWSR